MKATCALLRKGSNIIDDASFQADAKAATERCGKAGVIAETVQKKTELAIVQSSGLIEELADNSSAPDIRSADWGIVFGGDSSLQKAQQEITSTVAKYDLPNSKIFLDKNGSYRAVSVLPSAKEARIVLEKAKALGRDAYLVNLEHWCPGAIVEQSLTRCAKNP